MKVLTAKKYSLSPHGYRRRGTVYVHIFKLRVVGITRKKKDD